MRKGKAVKVRLHGIACPEIGQPFGTKAKSVTSDLAFRKGVEVRVLDTDRYGRLVGEVILPNVRQKGRFQMDQETCPKCGLVSPKEQYICSYCWAKLREKR